MKMTEYPVINSFDSSNILITDGVDGTKQIGIENAVLSALHCVSSNNHRLIYRGKNLGNSLTTAQKASIQNGTFDDLWIGDYWTINGVYWRIADFDYWYNTGDTSCTKHHAVIIPNGILYTAEMNSSKTTTGGYTNSDMYKTKLANAVSAIKSAFGSSVMSHREWLCDTVTNGVPSGSNWQDVDAVLPNEYMLYGHPHFIPASTGSSVPVISTIDKTQLALFNIAPSMITVPNAGIWLRDPVSSTDFASISSTGNASHSAANNTLGVRPVFAIY